jgi:integrase
MLEPIHKLSVQACIPTMTNQSIPKNAQDPRKARSSSGGKNSLAYWERRIFLPTYSVHGKSRSAQNYAVELQYQRRRVRWSLGAALTKSIAAERAKALYFFLHAHGWDATIAKYRPEILPQADPTIGAFIEAVELTSTIHPRTLHGYCAALRKIVADLNGLADDSSKYGLHNSKWVERIHAIKLSTLSPAAIQAWKRSFLAKARQDPIGQRRARTSVNAFLRNARALFSAKIVRHLNLVLPDPLPFTGVEYEPRGNTKYNSAIDIHALVEAAKAELSETDPEAFKAFLLAGLVGLRKKEIDLLEWPSFQWEKGAISIAPTATFSKTEDSYGVVSCDPELMELFRGYATQSVSGFVLTSARTPRPDCLYDYYRAKEVFTRLTEWLRAHGVRTAKPLHTLRKEFGSMICQRAGIHAASRALRHSNVGTTDLYYTDSRARVTTGLGHLLGTKIVEFKQPEVA